jgi:hypothetical protein
MGKGIHWPYLLAALGLFLVEVLIALYVRDGFVRPYAGDFLVVILLYCLVRALTRWPQVWAGLGVLLFAYMVEFLQYCKLLDVIGLQGNRLANIVFGSSFEWSDMLAYTLGITAVLFVERACKHHSAKHFFK